MISAPLPATDPVTQPQTVHATVKAGLASVRSLQRLMEEIVAVVASLEAQSGPASPAEVALSQATLKRLRAQCTAELEAVTMLCKSLDERENEMDVDQSPASSADESSDPELAALRETWRANSAVIRRLQDEVIGFRSLLHVLLSVNEPSEMAQ
ncbi:hypothetical protein H9P43_000447 [Blastocladiella emersonii ATCC 22665]|nr:hypothetical protein H9P43_000447 [Blastocladiella emersonii ATCC 22665]